jgi:hypothetical protein
MKTLLTLATLCFIVIGQLRSDDGEERALTLPPELAVVYLKRDNPKLLCVETSKLEPLVSANPPFETKMVVAKTSEQYELVRLNFNRVDGTVISLEEASKKFRHPSKAIFADHEFNKKNEYYTYFDNQLIVVSRKAKSPDEKIEVIQEFRK